MFSCISRTLALVAAAALLGTALPAAADTQSSGIFRGEEYSVPVCATLVVAQSGTTNNFTVTAPTPLCVESSVVWTVNKRRALGVLYSAEYVGTSSENLYVPCGRRSQVVVYQDGVHVSQFTVAGPTCKRKPVRFSRTR